MKFTFSTSSVRPSSATSFNGGHSASFSHPTSTLSSRPTVTLSVCSTLDREESLASSLSFIALCLLFGALQID